MMRTLVSGLLVLSFFGAAHEVHEEARPHEEEVVIKAKRPHAPHREGEAKIERDEEEGR